MELNHQAVRPGTGFEAALHAVALPSLTVVACWGAECRTRTRTIPIYEIGALPVELIRQW